MNKRFSNLSTDKKMIFEDDRLYSLSEAARIWGCCRKTMYNIVEKHPYLVKRQRKLGRNRLIGQKLNTLYYS